MLLPELRSYEYKFIQCHWKEYMLFCYSRNGKTMSHDNRDIKKVWFDKLNGEVRFLKNEVQLYYSFFSKVNINLFSGNIHKGNKCFKVFLLFGKGSLTLFFICDFYELDSFCKEEIFNRFIELTNTYV